MATRRILTCVPCGRFKRLPPAVCRAPEGFARSALSCLLLLIGPEVFIERNDSDRDQDSQPQGEDKTSPAQNDEHGFHDPTLRNRRTWPVRDKSSAHFGAT